MHLQSMKICGQSRIAYPEAFSVLFSEEIDLFFLSNNIIELGNEKGIAANGGGNALIQYYDKIPKITEEVRCRWKMNLT